MHNEIDPKRQVDFFTRLLGLVTGIPEDKRLLASSIVPMNFIDVGFIFDPAQTLPEQMIILQEKSPRSQESANKRTLCVEFSVNRFKLITYNTPGSLEEELERRRSILDKRKNPDVFTNEELTSPSLDPLTLFGFNRGAKASQEFDEKHDYKERPMDPLEISTVISGLTALTPPAAISQAEEIMKHFFEKQFE